MSIEMIWWRSWNCGRFIVLLVLCWYIR